MTDRTRDPAVGKAALLENPRRDKTGQIRLMAAAEGFVMVRRPGFVPWIMTFKEWEALPMFTPDTKTPDDKTEEAP